MGLTRSEGEEEGRKPGWEYSDAVGGPLNPNFPSKDWWAPQECHCLMSSLRAVTLRSSMWEHSHGEKCGDGFSCITARAVDRSVPFS